MRVYDSMSDERNQPDLDLREVATLDELHDRLASRFGFPDYYGRKWDAFDDCIWDLGPTTGTLRVRGWRGLSERLPRDATMLRSCLEDHAKNNPELHIVWD
jgi:ribonuclease inhibitor